MRSLNSLLERFHHSTTFYVLLSPDYHVPFQMHIIPPLLLTIILVLQVSVVMQTNKHLKGLFMLAKSAHIVNLNVL